MHHDKHAVGGASHALIQKDETRVCSAGPEDQQAQATNAADFRSEPTSDQLQALAQLRDRLAPAGWGVALGARGGFIAVKWGHVVSLPDQQAAAEFADREAGKPSWSDAAALAIDGEDFVRAYLQRLAAGTAQPDDLATLLEFLKGPTLKGAARALEKALLRGGRHA
jgi:hypothetical protein